MCTDLGIHCSKSARDCMKWGPGRIGSHLRPKRSSHQSEFVFILFFRFGFFIIDRDPFLTEPCQTWQIYVHSLQRWVFSCDFLSVESL